MSSTEMQKCAEDASTEEHTPTTCADASSEPQANQHDPKVILAYTACALIWGTTWYAIRVCIGPNGYPTFPAAALRFTFSSVALALVWFFYRRKIKQPTAKEVLWISIAGLLSGIAYGLLYSAEEKIAGGLAAVLSATSPLIAAIMAMMTRTEKLSKPTIYGSAVALVGVATVFHDRLQVSADQASAVGILIFNAFLNSSSNVAMKHNARHTAALASNTIFFLAAATTLWVTAAIAGDCSIPSPLPLAPTVALLYLTVFGTLLAFACFFYLLRTTRLSNAMTLAFVTPVIALVVDAFWERNVVLTMQSYIGIGIVLTGVAISVLLKARSSN
jgi:drug/metabolite transporter (DMT)-like permease